MPRLLSDAVAAYQLRTEGLVSPKGVVELKPGQIPGYQIAERAFGAQPTAVTETHERREAVSQEEDRIKSEHSRLAARLAILLNSSMAPTAPTLSTRRRLLRGLCRRQHWLTALQA
jgi:hypothetical protein